MKKIKILLVFTVGLAVLYATHFFADAFILDTPKYMWDEGIVLKFDFIYSYGIEIAIFTALIYISIGLIKVIKSGIFISASSKFLKIGGVLFLIVSFTDFIYAIRSMLELDNPEQWLQRIFTNFLLFILGLTAIIVSDVLKQGSLIKNENDLTI